MSPATRTFETSVAAILNFQGSKGNTVYEENPQTSFSLNAMHGHDVHVVALKRQPLKKLTPEQVQEAISLYQSGLSLAKVAERFGVSRQAMHDLLKRRIKLRGRIEALPRKEATAIRKKRAATLRRYRSRASRVTRAQIRAVWMRDQVCQMCEAEGEEIDHIVPVALGGQTEMENLQLLCRSCHNEKSRRDREEVRLAEASRRSTCSAEASRDCAKTSPSPASERDSKGNAPPSSSSSHESLTLFAPAGFSSRTFPDFFPPTVDEISPSFSRRWPSSGMAWRGECWTLDTSESPRDGAECSLSDILEPTVPSRFFLSSKAAAGILRRAERRGRELPEHLRSALSSVAGTAPRSEPTKPQEGTS